VSPIPMSSAIIKTMFGRAGRSVWAEVRPAKNANAKNSEILCVKECTVVYLKWFPNLGVAAGKQWCLFRWHVSGGECVG